MSALRDAKRKRMTDLERKRASRARAVTQARHLGSVWFEPTTKPSCALS